MKFNADLVKALATASAATLVYLLFPSDAGEATRRTAAIFVMAAGFWAMEIIPLYATSLLVVLMNVFLLARPGGVLDMDEQGYQIFLVPFASPIIMLFFGGFVLAAALHKYQLDHRMAALLLRAVGKRPFAILCGMMAITAFLSMWVSNTATAAMMMVLVRPLCDQLEDQPRFRAGLVLSIPFGANLGGIGTPVGSPPNAIALGILQQQGFRISFLNWMLFAVPLMLILLVLSALWLHKRHPATVSRIAFELDPPASLNRKERRVALIALGTVLLWLTSGWHGIPEALVGLLAAGAFAALSLLDREDFKQLNWDILLLMWGGLALGRGMEVGGLSEWVVGQPLFQVEGLLLIAIATAVALVLSTVMSNTATATLLLPIVVALSGGHPLVLGVTVALACSFAMALPVSTPPNAIAFASNRIRSLDMLQSGLVISLFSWTLLILSTPMLRPLIRQLSAAAP